MEVAFSMSIPFAIVILRKFNLKKVVEWICNIFNISRGYVSVNFSCFNTIMPKYFLNKAKIDSLLQ